MTWFDNIKDLQYYHQPKDVPCYCEAVAYPFDLYLQGHIPNGSRNYTLNIYVYSADGLTQYENATSYFQYYFGAVPGGNTHFFNARLKSFSPAMCAHECYILRAQVVQSNGVFVFDKYTERYCQNNCCNVAANITFEQAGFAPMVTTNEGNDPAAVTQGGDVVVAGSNPTLYIPTGNCGEQLIRIISKFDCIDNFTGDFYGTPGDIISGSADFEYRKITTMRGRIVRRPREISREMSYNCKLQRAESTAQYLLEGFEFLPPWKMYEIEGQLHANRIFIDDFSGVREYRYPGGTPMKQVSKCFELFKLEATLEDCTQRQVFGCAPGCITNVNFDGSDKLFAIPASYSGGGFYNSNRELIAADYDGLLDYFRTRTGATGVNDVDTGSMNCSAYKVVGVSSTGQIDTHIYYDGPVANNKVYGVVAGNINDMCSYLPAICAVPAPGTVSIAVAVCAVPVNGTVSVTTLDTDEVNITGFGNWVADEGATTGTVYNNEVSINLHVVNSTLTEDPDAPDDDVILLAQVAVVGSHGRPSAMAVLNSNNNPLPEGVTITIDNHGAVMYYGPATDAAATNVTIEIYNLKYNI